LLAILLSLPFGAFAEEKPGGADEDEAFEQMKLLTEALIHIRRHYVEEKGFEEIVHGALRGMLYSLDPHSGFLDSDDYREIQDSTSGAFGGVGVQVGVRDGLLTIIAPIEDTPGFRAGLQAGDRILEIDGEKTQGLPLSECVKRMRGKKGEDVVLVVQGAQDEKPRRVVVTRDLIRISSVKGKRLIRGDVGYIRLASFDEGTADNLQKALDELLEQGMAALVLDLRNNPGGLLRASVDVASKFLKRGKLIVTRKGRRGTHAEVTDKAYGDVHLIGFPMVVLVNGGSASASEIVAGALQDHKRAVVVGSTTYGKASVQSVIKLQSAKPDEDCAIRLTTAHYYTPNGREIHAKGIRPDIFVPLTPAEWRDIVIRRAHIETPDAFSREEKEKYVSVVDHQLARAVDLLEALKIYQERQK